MSIYIILPEYYINMNTFAKWQRVTYRELQLVYVLILGVALKINVLTLHESICLTSVDVSCTFAVIAIIS